MVLTMMMYQLLTTVSSNKVTAKGKGERQVSESRICKVGLQRPLPTYPGYHAPKRRQPHLPAWAGSCRKISEVLPAPCAPTHRGLSPEVHALCLSSLSWTRAWGGGGGWGNEHLDLNLHRSGVP